MALICKHGKGECTGCMECECAPRIVCPACGHVLYDGDARYIQDNEVIGCEYCTHLELI